MKRRNAWHRVARETKPTVVAVRRPPIMLFNKEWIFDTVYEFNKQQATLFVHFRKSIQYGTGTVPYRYRYVNASND
jgi:hypothetical protein